MVSLLGVFLLLFVAVGLSSNRSAIRPRAVLLAFGLQGGIGFVALWTDWGIAALAAASEHVAKQCGDILGGRGEGGNTPIGPQRHKPNAALQGKGQ